VNIFVKNLKLQGLVYKGTDLPWPP